jgi:hypothetical protein
LEAWADYARWNHRADTDEVGTAGVIAPKSDGFSHELQPDKGQFS